MNELEAYYHIQNKFKKGEDVFAPCEALQVVLNSPELSFCLCESCRNLIGNEHLEKAISQSGEFSFKYSKFKRKFKLGEPAIAKNANYLYLYCKDNIKTRLKKYEHILANNVEYGYLYSKNVIKGRFELYEHNVIKDPRNAVLYAKNIIKGRWPEAEQYIAKNAAAALDYVDFTKTRLEEAEPLIAKNAFYSYYYSLGIKERFFLGEPEIARDPNVAFCYSRDVIKGRFETAEKNISENEEILYSYVKMWEKPIKTKNINWAYKDLVLSFIDRLFKHEF